MKITIRVLTLFLAVTMMIACVPAVSASVVASGTCEENLTWTLENDGTLTISGTGYMGDRPWESYKAQIKKVIIKPGVTSICNWAFSDCVNLTSVTIPSGVTHMGGAAFSGCASLKSITIPEGVTDLGEYLLDGTAITTLSIPASVTQIGTAYSLCYECPNLTGIWVDENNKCYSSDSYGVLFDKNKTTLMQAPALLTGNYRIPDSVTGTYFRAFENCTKLTGVVVSPNIVEIVMHTFSGCTGLKTAVLPEGVEMIDGGAFQGCSSLTSVTIPDSLRYFDSSAFYGCDQMRRTQYGNAEYLEFNNNLYFLLESSDVGAAEILVHPETKRIGAYACSENENLTSVLIPSSVNVICDYAFYSCKNLSSVKMNAGLKRVEGGAFEGCESLTTVVFPEGLELIGGGAFRHCTNLEHVSIPDSLIYLGGEAFDECEKLTFAEYENALYLGNQSNPYVAMVDLQSLDIEELNVHPNTSAIHSKYWNFTRPVMINVGKNLVYIDDFYFATNIKGYRVDPQNKLFSSDSHGVLFNKNKTVLLRAPVGLTGTYTIPEGVERIAESAFDGCENLTQVIIPASVTEIGLWAFSGTGLTSVRIPDGVTVIYSGTFNCNKLRTVTIGKGVKLINAWAFGPSVAAIHYMGTPSGWKEVGIHGESGLSADVLVTYELREGWAQKDSKWYYYRSGEKVTGWLLDGSTWYYMDSQGAMQTGWQQIGGTWYYFKSGGAMVTGWQQIGSTWYYFNSSGAMVTSWQQIGGTWYYFNSSGAMVTGWQQIGGTWYYFNSSGAMVTGWLQVGSTWYYFKSGGAMATGWLQVGNTWYYFKTSGAMASGWLQVGGTWYFFQSGGAMQTGWLKIGNTWYYFHSSGAMATSPVTLGGKTYRFDANGACLNP